MQIVLPGALPDPREARELTSYLHKTAPTLLRWLQRGHARIIPADPARTGCTPYEQWQLIQRGFAPQDGQNLSAGLAPLWAKHTAQSNSPIWLAELVHVSPSRDGAALLPASELTITPEQSVALFESAQSIFTGTGFTAHPCSTEHWRLELPPDFTPQCASPTLVSISSVNDWWPQDIAARPWRRLVNELQMLWFEHPVNQARYQQGLAPINSLWLFGGGNTNQLRSGGQPTEVKTYDTLLAPSISHDWGGWLAALDQLEAHVFSPLARSKPPKLVLTGKDRLIEVGPSAWGQLTQWLPNSQQAWRKWWSHQD